MGHTQEKGRRYIGWLRALQLVGVFTAFGCMGGNCFSGSSGDTYVPPPGTGLELFHTSEEWDTEKVYTRGESFQFQAKVIPITGEVLGETVTVTPEVPTGCTVTPATRDVVLTAAPVMADFTLTIAENAPATDDPIIVNRTEAAPGSIDTRATNDSAPFKLVEQLVTATLSPTNLNIALGGNGTVTLSVLPRGSTSGTVRLFSVLNTNGLDVTPAAFNVNLVRGSTTPVLVTLTATSTGASSDSGELIITTADSVKVAQSIVSAGDNQPSFEFSATPTFVTTPNNELSSLVTFRLQTIRNFSGPVVINYSVQGYGAVSPTDNNFTVNLTGGSQVFTKKFYRYETSSNPVIVVWTATSGSITKTFNFEIRQPGEGR